VSFKDNKQRITEHIKELVIEKGFQCDEGIMVENFLIHEDIAKMTVSNILAGWSTGKPTVNFPEIIKQKTQMSAHKFC
jgi:hypothetical protein